MQKILITDSLFVANSEWSRLERAGFKPMRLREPNPAPNVLIEELKDCSGYILGGVERVTREIVRGAPRLKAIVFTGADYAEFLPGLEEATRQGIAVANCPGGNSFSVAEFTLSLMLSLARRVPLTIGSLSSLLDRMPATGDASELEAPRLSDVNLSEELKTLFHLYRVDSLIGVRIGVVGLGSIAQSLVPLLTAFPLAEIAYFSRKRNRRLEAIYNLRFRELDELFQESDVISVHLPNSAGAGFINATHLDLMRAGSLFVSTSGVSCVDVRAVYAAVAGKRIRAAFDGPFGPWDWIAPEELQQLTNECRLLVTRRQVGFMSKAANDVVSSMAVTSLLNLLATGDDAHLVNPNYVDHI